MDKLKEVIEFLKKNNAPAELITQLESLKTVNLESVKEFLEKDEAGKKYLQTLNDAAVTKGILTFKEKTMPGLIEDEIKRKFPDETEEQKKLRILTDDQAKLKAEIKRKDLLNKATTLAVEKKLPLKLVERFLGDDEDATIKNMELFEAEYNAGVTAAVDAKFKENGREPGNSPQHSPGPDYSKMSDDEYFKHRMSEKK
ncbi:MAG: DUF4355 domain-containing protein [Melioribacter sp.]|nr:DUF4355 domain-containing protein [Melioribacter sp.]